MCTCHVQNEFQSETKCSLHSVLARSCLGFLICISYFEYSTVSVIFQLVKMFLFKITWYYKSKMVNTCGKITGAYSICLDSIMCLSSHADTITEKHEHLLVLGFELLIVQMNMNHYTDE